MESRENKQASSTGSQATGDQLSGVGKGPQGIDKAPGEETSQDTEHVTMETQKGKKVDADPSKESDRPAEQQG